MTAKRFTFHHDVDGVDYIEDENNGFCLICDELMCSLLNELHEENQRLKKENNSLIDGIKNTAKQGADLSTKIWQSKNTPTTITGRYYD